MAKTESKTKSTIRVQHNSNVHLHYKKGVTISPKLSMFKTNKKPNYHSLNVTEVFLHFKS